MLLLDTHTLIWFIYDDANLPETAKNRIITSQRVFVSIASIWEIAIKQAIGKLNIANTPTEIADACNASDISILPVKPEHLDLLKDLPFIHKDPFDRLLVAQAKTERLTIVTRDVNLQKYPLETLW